jgi:UDP-N-acetylglucosamine 1-carboxyvinyltransferase
MGEKFLIEGGVKLEGKVEICGGKNSAGAVLAGALLSKEPTIISNLPLCLDVLNQIKILEEMGAKIEWLGKRTIKIDPKEIDPQKLPFEIFEKMRVSVLLIPPLLVRFKKIKVPRPGGDKIGLRPITTHLKMFQQFGISFKEKEWFYFFELKEKELIGRRIILDEFSVTATENAMMMAVLAKGKSKIEIAAAEPQVQDLGNLLIKMGAKIKGLGTHTIEIEGVKKLFGTEFEISPDWAEAGTFLIAFAITKGKGEILNVKEEHLTFFLKKMREIGVNFKIEKNKISVFPSKKFNPTKIQILPYPGFPTDLQPQTSVLLLMAKGKSLIHDPLYEGRFSHLQELRKMGADIEIVDPHRALIFGGKKLFGTKVQAPDIRAGVSLVLAGLVAKGKTIVENVYQIDRGYEEFEEKLKKLGAKIKRIS